MTIACKCISKIKMINIATGRRASVYLDPDKKFEDADARKRKTMRQRIWNIAAIVFGGIAIAYGMSSEEHFATVAGAAIAAIGIIKLVKSEALQRRTAT